MSEDQWDVENPTCAYCGEKGHYVCGTIGISKESERIKSLESQLSAANEKLREYKIKAQMNIHNSAFNGLVDENTKLTQANKVMREALEIHLPPIFDDGCEGCRESMRITKKALTHADEIMKPSGDIHDENGTEGQNSNRSVTKDTNNDDIDHDGGY